MKRLAPIPASARTRALRRLGVGGSRPTRFGYRVFVPAPLADKVARGFEPARFGLEARDLAYLEGCDGLLRALPESAPPAPPAGDDPRTLNVARAAEHARGALESGPPGLDLLLGAHRILFAGTPREGRAGRWRTRQNWVGGRRGPHAATYVPPGPGEIGPLLADLERFLAPENPLPPLVQAAVAFGQLELIHPFFDGNGRMGRLLSQWVLASRGIRPALSLPVEACLRRRRRRYLAQMVSLHRSGGWRAWILFVARTYHLAARDLEAGRKGAS